MSPSERLFIDPDRTRAALARACRELGAELRFGTELVECEQDADGVTADHPRPRERRDVDRAVAVPGRRRRPAQPDPRRARDRDDGPRVFSKAITIYFRADVEPLLRGRNLSVVLVMNDVLRGLLPHREAVPLRLPRRPLGRRLRDRRSSRVTRRLGPRRAALRRAVPRLGWRTRRRPTVPIEDVDALAGDGGRRGALPGRAHLPGRRRGARHAAVRRLRRQHRHPRRAEPRLEARGGAQRRGLAGASRHVRRSSVGRSRGSRPSRRTRATSRGPRRTWRQGSAPRRRPLDRPRRPRPFGRRDRRARRRRP